METNSLPTVYRINITSETEEGDYLIIEYNGNPIAQFICVNSQISCVKKLIFKPIIKSIFTSSNLSTIDEIMK